MNTRRTLIIATLAIGVTPLFPGGLHFQPERLSGNSYPAIKHSATNGDSSKVGVEHRTKFDPSRDAAKDIAEAVLIAKKDGRRILLDVGGEWCIWCHRLDKFFEDNADVADFLGHNFVVVKVNWSPENHNEIMLSKYPKISGYPHLFVLESDGAFLHSQDTGALESGKAHDHDKVLRFLKAWAPKPRS